MAEINLDSTSLENSIQQQRMAQWRDSSEKAQIKSDQDFKDLERANLDFFKNSTILAGSVFGSTLALSAGKPTSNLLILGEGFLIISILIGLFSLKASLNSKEWRYFFNQKYSLGNDLIMYKDLMPDFLFKASEDSIKSFDLILNKPAYIKILLKIIPISFVEPLFYGFLISGLICLWFSLFVSLPDLPKVLLFKY